MNLRPKPQGPSAAQANNRGGAPVGWLNDFGPLEAGAVMCLRMWCESDDKREQVWTDFAAQLGVGWASSALQSFEEICDLCSRHGRRPLMRNRVSCKCVGADEACFAHFVAAATEGQHDDAFMIASVLVRPDFASSLVGLAQEFGLAVKRLTRHDFSEMPLTPVSSKLH